MISQKLASLSGESTSILPAPAQGPLKIQLSLGANEYLEQLHTGLTSVLEAASAKNTHMLRTKQEIVKEQQEQIDNYIKVYSKFRSSCKVLMIIRSKAFNSDLAIQHNYNNKLVKKAVFKFLVNLFVLREWNAFYSKKDIPSSQTPTAQNHAIPSAPLRYQNVGTEEIKQAPISDSPSAAERNERSIIDVEPATIDPINPAASRMPSLSSLLPPTPRPLPKRNMQGQLPHLRSCSVAFPVIVRQQQTDFNEFQCLAPIEEFCELKIDFWHLTEAVRSYALYTLKINFEKENYNSRDFELYTDTTAFQGKVASYPCQAAHMNFRPQTYDLIAYRVLENIAGKNKASPLEKYFLEKRKIWNANDDVSTMKQLFEEFDALIKSGGPLNFPSPGPNDPPARLNEENFRLITSIFAQTHFELASNATCDSPALSNDFDGEIEAGMKSLIKKFTHNSFNLAGKEPQVVLTKSSANKKLSVSPKVGYMPAWWPYRLHIPKPTYVQDSLPIALDQSIEIVEDLVKKITRSYKDFYSLKFDGGRNTPSNDRQKEINKSSSADFGSFISQLMSDFLVPSEVASGLKLPKIICKNLDEWLKEHHSSNITHNHEEIFYTPKIEELEKNIAKSKYHQAEHELAKKHNDLVDLNVLSFLNKSPLEALEPVLEYPDFFHEVKNPKSPQNGQIIQMNVRPKDSILTFRAKEDVRFKQRHHLKELSGKFKALLYPEPKLPKKPPSDAKTTKDLNLLPDNL